MKTNLPATKVPETPPDTTQTWDMAVLEPMSNAAKAYHELGMLEEAEIALRLP